jgi:DNA-binding NarL/FixJ family response regulator
VDIALGDGHIRHVPRGPRLTPHLPIDLFLRTLADVKGHQALAVILSGTGADGTLGCQAVRAQGGIAFAQEPGSARFDGMPHSAIAAGYDLIREVRKRPAEKGGSVPALALTAYAAAEDREKTAAAGFQSYLAKPAAPAELVTRAGALAGR